MTGSAEGAARLLELRDLLERGVRSPDGASCVMMCRVAEPLSCFCTSRAIETPCEARRRATWREHARAVLDLEADVEGRAELPGSRRSTVRQQASF
jgi:hypothetical protein